MTENKMQLTEFEAFVRSVLLCADCAEKGVLENQVNLFVNQEVASISEHQTAVSCGVVGQS